MLYKSIIRPVLFRGDAEDAHGVGIHVVSLLGRISPVATYLTRVNDPRLSVSVFGLTFNNPVGLAAGVDKDGIAINGWEALGAGFTEIGTVTLRPQVGNRRPRVFRLVADSALINRLGFNSEGAVAVSARLAIQRKRRTPLGINVGRNSDTANADASGDYTATVRQLIRFADYVVLNVSSPNTEGLRQLQEPTSTATLVRNVVAVATRVAAENGEAPVPVLVKIAPDSDCRSLFETVDAALASGAAGIVATNTTTSRDGLLEPTDESGGLSGAPLRHRANTLCRALYEHTNGCVPIIGVGGIFNAADAYERIGCGAHLVQVCTGLIYEGPSIFHRINRGLIKLITRDGFPTVAAAVGKDCRLGVR